MTWRAGNVLQSIIVLICSTGLTPSEEADMGKLTRAEMLEGLLENYTTTPPNFNKDEPTYVDVAMHIHGFDSVSEINMDYSMSLLITQVWDDPKLKFTDPLGKIQFLELDVKNMNKVWVPDIYFANEKRAEFHEVTVPNKLMHIYENGTVWYSARVTLTATCPMQLENFPMDSQICPLYIKSFTYTTENVKLRWKCPTDVDRPTCVKLDEFELPQFELDRTVNLSDCTGKTSDKYTCLEASFKLRRCLGYYVIQIYVPCVLIVMLSWVSFWLHTDAVPARISLGILTVLTMTTQNDSTQGSLPKVSYIKAIDVWNFLCQVFVFAALLEYAIVNYLSRKQTKRYRKRIPTDNEDDCACDLERKSMKRYVCMCSIDSAESYDYVPDDAARKHAIFIDELCRRLFPVVYFILFTIYWVFYGLWERTTQFN